MESHYRELPEGTQYTEEEYGISIFFIQYLMPDSFVLIKLDICLVCTRGHKANIGFICLRSNNASIVKRAEIDLIRPKNKNVDIYLVCTSGTNLDTSSVYTRFKKSRHNSR